MARAKLSSWAESHPNADACGPGSPAWEHSDAAIRHYINGRRVLGGAAKARMRRALKFQGQAEQIPQWVNYIAGRVANPEPDDYDE